MRTLAPLVKTKQYERAANSWHEMLQKGDNVSVLFFPFTDRIRRIEQFTEESAKQKGDTYTQLFLVLDPQYHTIEEKEDLTDFITDELIKKGVITKKEPFTKIIAGFASKRTQLVIIILTAETLLLPKNRLFLSVFYEILSTFNPFMVSLCCFETDITHPEYQQIVRPFTQLLNNIYYYPLYGQTDTTTFIQYLSHKWTVPVTPKQTEHIRSLCSGHFWFLKDAVRQLRTQKEWSEESDGMTYRKNMLISSLLPSERGALLKILTGRKTFDLEEQHSLQYLMKLRVITEDNHLMLPIIKKTLLESVGTKHALTYENNMVYLNQVPIGKFFSRKEIRALKALVSKPGVIITRENLAQAIWPVDTDTNYSDWAIDQIIARVRKRLPEFEISPSSIKSIRGKGYMYIQL